ncbi:anti-sigma factor family protein [Streptomyces sp. NPDC127108]|uniref:anti-sigma factor family protein n=1 Tax=Streptomyces sp. NPDC127108 TaxID=3345361 RepID=UPI0036304451
MTTTTDSAGHPDVAEISDLTEGLLSPSRTLDVRQHLDDCPLCADVYASLEEIRGMLGSLPGPTRMPTDVAERIDAALAAEALLDSTATATVTEVEGVSLDGSDRESDAAADSGRETTVEPVAHVSRETSPTDAPKPTAGSGALPTSTTSSPSAHGPAGHPRAATGPGRGGRLRSRRRRTTMLGAVFTAAALGLGALLIQPWSDDSTDSTTASSTGKDTFSKSKLEAQVSDLLSEEQKISGTDTGGKKPSFDTRSSPEGTPQKGSTMREEYVEVPACIEKGLGGRTPLAASKGTYEGTNAYLVVVPHDTDGAKVSAYVVDAACVSPSASPDAKGKVLLTESYARP